MTSANTSDNEPITLSWSRTLQTEVSNPQFDSEAATMTPSENPPGYSAVRKPTRTLQYTFSQLGSNSMLLVPPSTAPDTRPQYYITTNTNVFMPMRMLHLCIEGRMIMARGWESSKQESSQTAAKIQIKSVNCAIRTIFQKQSALFSDTRTWHWVPPGSLKKFMLKWEYRMNSAKCTSLTIGTPQTHLATFNFPYPGSTKLYGETALEVTVAGQDYFDHILLSLLLCERKRLSPKFHISRSGTDLWIFNL